MNFAIVNTLICLMKSCYKISHPLPLSIRFINYKIIHLRNHFRSVKYLMISLSTSFRATIFWSQFWPDFLPGSETTRKQSTRIFVKKRTGSRHTWRKNLTGILMKRNWKKICQFLWRLNKIALNIIRFPLSNKAYHKFISFHFHSFLFYQKSRVERFVSLLWARVKVAVSSAEFYFAY